MNTEPEFVASAPMPADSSRVHWMVRLNRRNRMIFFGLLALVFGLHLHQVQAGAGLWAGTLLLLLVSPQGIYFYSSHPEKKAVQRQREIGAMRLEAFLFTLWCAAAGFALWPSFILAAAMCLNLMVYEGLAGLRRLLVAVLAGLAVSATLMQGLVWHPETSLLVSVSCMLVFTGFLATFAYSGYVRAAQLHDSHRQAEGQLAAIQALQARLREAALSDPLTGLHNRRHLSEALPGALARCARLKLPVTLVMIDIDHFKRVNDTHGHAAGDAMLQALARLLQGHVRQGDTVCRMGGEEFLLVLENAALEPAWERTQALRAAFAELVVTHEGASLHATISCGLATFPEDGSDAPSLLQASDRALYAAKEAGRNQLRATRRMP